MATNREIMNEKSSPKYKICPNCSFFCRIEENDNYCLRCGTELLDKCPNCNNSIDYPYAKYCKHCGNQLPGRLAMVNNNLKEF